MTDSNRITAESSLAVRCQSITKNFGPIHALQNITVDIQKGEFFMLVGPSGCGKTTLLSIIAGILKPTSGVCSIHDTNIFNLSEEDRLLFRSLHVGFIFQSFNLIPTISLLENVAIPLIIRNIDSDEAEEKAKTILELVGLKPYLKSRLSQLSGGQQQRVAIARALIHRPSVLICDEPTSALDHATGASVMDLMKDIQRELKTTFVVVTHDSRIYNYADRIAHMDDGTIIDIQRT